MVQSLKLTLPGKKNIKQGLAAGCHEVDGGVSTAVNFTNSGQLLGNYAVEVAGLNGNFVVSKSGILPWLWPVAVGAFVLGITLAVALALARGRKT